jgi:cysteine desulfurase
MRIDQTIYLDHHATTPVDRKVLDKMLPFFGEDFANPHSSDHAFGWSAMRAVEDAARQVARLLGIDSDEVVFTSGATEANNLALLGLESSPLARERRGILIGAIDHKSVLATARILAQHGFAIEYVRVDSDGQIDLADLEQKLQHSTLAVSVGLVNSEIGAIQNISAIAELARNRGVLVHCDAAQAPCAMDMNSIADCADLISLSAHKLYGPKGIGALYIRRDVQDLIKPQIHGGGQQRNLRSGTLPVPLCIGFGAAAALLTGAEARDERQRIAALRDLFVDELHRLPWPTFINGGAPRHPGNANVRFSGLAAEDILAATQPYLAASTGSACTSGITEPSHVLRAIGLSADDALSSIRFCIGRFTTTADVIEAVRMIGEAIDKLRHIATVPTETHNFANARLHDNG